MTTNGIKCVDDEYDIPLDISDLISVCREYNKLGWQIQNQVESILDMGVQQAIETGLVKRESLPHIKSFLKSIISNPYFGDAVDQASECLFLIDLYYDKNKINSILIN